MTRIEGSERRTRTSFNLLEFYGSLRRFILRYSVREISDSSTEEMKLALKTENLAQLVYFIRGEKVMSMPTWPDFTASAPRRSIKRCVAIANDSLTISSFS